MNNTIYTSDTEVIALGRKAFPDYNGKKFCVKISAGPYNCASYWDGGSRTYFRFIRLADGAITSQMPQQSAFGKKLEGIERVMLPVGMALVAHAYFCGKDMGLTIYVHPDNAPRFLPKKVELTQHEKIVLRFTSGLKSSYGGISNYRYHEANKVHDISLDDWNAAKQSCIEKGLLRKNGSITNEGRNNVDSTIKTYKSYF